MNMFILGIGTVNQLFVEVLILQLSFQKNEIVSDKNSFFMIGSFCTAHSICLNIRF